MESEIVRIVAWDYDRGIMGLMQVSYRSVDLFHLCLTCLRWVRGIMNSNAIIVKLVTIC